jgi:hypothetical protein
MAKSLFGKNPDMDDVEFIEAIEAAFGISFDNKEPEKWSTFGDVLDATRRRVGPVERGSFPCLSASAYRRIRSAILKERPEVDFRPDTTLATLIGRRRVRSWWRRLEQSSGLKLPAPVLTNWSGLLLVVVLFAVPGVVVVSGLPGWIAVLSPVFGLLSARWLPERPPVRTIGEFAHLAAALNAKGLSESHGAIRTRDVWSSLVWIARDSTGFTGPIERDTVLIG